VDDRPIVWDDANRKHLGSDHPERSISLAEIEEALHDVGRVETELLDREASQVVGRTAAGRWLVVIWIDDRDGRYPIHAREASRRIIRRISKMKTKAARKPFTDPFDELNDEEFEREVLESLDQATTKISLRVPKDLLSRAKDVAARRGVPYQALMKALIDQGLKRLERVRRVHQS